MFKSTKEFDAVMREILKSIIDEKTDLKDIFDKYGDQDAGDALVECIDRGLIKGYNYQTVISGKHVFNASTPRITYSGLSFLES